MRKILELLDTMRIYLLYFSSCFAVSTYILLLSVVDYEQGYIYNIIYIHVPCAWWSLIGYTHLSVFSLLYIITKKDSYLKLGKSISYVCLLVIMITLVTGSIWGKMTWGSYWEWDARLTSMFVLLLQVIGYRLIKDGLISSILGTIGWLNIPIIKWSVDWWRTLHQKSSLTLTSSSLDLVMGLSLLLITVSLGLLLFYLWMIEYRKEILS